MKKILLAAIVVLGACGPGEGVGSASDTLVLTKTRKTTEAPAPPTEHPATDTSDTTGFSNLRFKDVKVTETVPGEFLITGKGQIFEASFGWVIEDGHDELMQGHEMTDAGAPEWGNFRFTIKATPRRPNTTLHLILFELSAKDGTRQHELFIPLP